MKLFNKILMILKGVVDNVREQRAYQEQISSGASLGWGIDCIRFWVRSDQNSDFYGNS